MCLSQCVKNVRIRSYSGPYFPTFGLNMKRYSVSLQMREYTDQNNSEYGHFLRSVCLFIILKSHMIHMYIYKLIQTEDPEGYNL